MALRAVLLSLVACLGFDLPGRSEVECWSKSGRDWFSARVSDFSGWKTEVEHVLCGSEDSSPQVTESAVTTPDVSGRTDLAFDAVVDAMATTFAADLATFKAEPLEPSPGLAVAPPREMHPALPIVEVVPAPTPALEVSAVSTADKFSVAIRLTRQAVNAWASLIQGEDGPGDTR